MNNILKYVGELAKNGRDILADANKISLYRLDPELFNKLDFYNDDIYTEPYLILSLGY